MSFISSLNFEAKKSKSLELHPSLMLTPTHLPYNTASQPLALINLTSSKYCCDPSYDFVQECSIEANLLRYPREFRIKDSEIQFL